MLELITLVVTCKLWCDSWAGKRIRVFCDNETTVTVINIGRSRCPYLLTYIRELFKLAAEGQFVIRAVHCEGKFNIIPDALSRWDDDDKYPSTFRKLTQNITTTEYNVYDELFFCKYDV